MWFWVFGFVVVLMWEYKSFRIKGFFERQRTERASVFWPLLTAILAKCALDQDQSFLLTYASCTFLTCSPGS